MWGSPVDSNFHENPMVSLRHKVSFNASRTIFSNYKFGHHFRKGPDTSPVGWKCIGCVHLHFHAINLCVLRSRYCNLPRLIGTSSPGWTLIGGVAGKYCAVISTLIQAQNHTLMYLWTVQQWTRGCSLEFWSCSRWYPPECITKCWESQNRGAGLPLENQY